MFLCLRKPCAGRAARLTIQSCMILFQSSPVTMRKRTVMALPAVEKLACLRLEDTDIQTTQNRRVFTGPARSNVQSRSEGNEEQCEGKETLPVDVLSVLDGSKENDASEGVADEEEEHAHDDEEALVHADHHSQ